MKWKDIEDHADLATDSEFIAEFGLDQLMEDYMIICLSPFSSINAVDREIYIAI